MPGLGDEAIEIKYNGNWELFRKEKEEFRHFHINEMRDNLIDLINGMNTCGFYNSNFKLYPEFSDVSEVEEIADAVLKYFIK